MQMMKQQDMVVTGMILLVVPVGAYNLRMIVLTKERGRITVFARNVKKINHPLTGICRPFTFGTFALHEGRNGSYNIKNAAIENYFSVIKSDLQLIYYASYFCEFADYFTRENNDERDILKLLYQTLRILEKGTIPLELVRRIYEIKLLAYHGYGMETFACIRCGSKENLSYFRSEAGGVLCASCGKKEKSLKLGESTLYTLQYIMSSSVEKLYTFLVSKEVMKQLEQICQEFISTYVDQKFKSLEFLDSKY